jgi:hypothetical protein
MHAQLAENMRTITHPDFADITGYPNMRKLRCHGSQEMDDTWRRVF